MPSKIVRFVVKKTYVSRPFLLHMWLYQISIRAGTAYDIV